MYAKYPRVINGLKSAHNILFRDARKAARSFCKGPPKKPPEPGSCPQGCCSSCGGYPNCSGYPPCGCYPNCGGYPPCCGFPCSGCPSYCSNTCCSPPCGGDKGGKDPVNTTCCSPPSNPPCGGKTGGKKEPFGGCCPPPPGCNPPPKCNWYIPEVDCCGRRIVPPPECRPGPVPPNPCCPRYPKPGGYKIYRTIFFIVCLPLIIMQLMNVMSHHPCPKGQCREWEYMRRRTKRFPWGDGNKSLFHNDAVNHLPEECEPPELVCEEVP